MMEMLAELRRGTCKHCAHEIVQYQGDLSRDPVWYHAPAAGGALWCPDSKLAEPTDEDTLHP